MMLTIPQIDNNISWLLENGTPAVQFLTARHLVRTRHGSKKLVDLWNVVQTTDNVVAIFNGQEAIGAWCSKNPWATKPSYVPLAGYSPFTPKFVTTIWVMSVLGDMGFTVKDTRIKKATEYVQYFQLPSGLFSRFNITKAVQHLEADRPSENTPCDLGVYLAALGKVGMGKDYRLKKSYDLLVQWQREDGGWITQKHKDERHWTRSCPASSGWAAMALYHSGRPEYREALYRALGFLVWHLSIKKDDEIRQFYYHGHNMVKELVVLSELGVGLTERPVQILLNWLVDMYHPDEAHFSYQGRGPTSSSPGWERYYLYHLIEDDWLTYYATRIAVNLRNTQPGDPADVSQST
jgi:hypothetical protein